MDEFITFESTHHVFHSIPQHLRNHWRPARQNMAGLRSAQLPIDQVQAHAPLDRVRSNIHHAVGPARVYAHSRVVRGLHGRPQHGRTKTILHAAGAPRRAHKLRWRSDRHLVKHDRGATGGGLERSADPHRSRGMFLVFCLSIRAHPLRITIHINIFSFLFSFF
jgi:hypothetical protein